MARFILSADQVKRFLMGPAVDDEPVGELVATTEVDRDQLQELRDLVSSTEVRPFRGFDFARPGDVARAAGLLIQGDGPTPPDIQAEMMAVLRRQWEETQARNAAPLGVMRYAYGDPSWSSSLYGNIPQPEMPDFEATARTVGAAGISMEEAQRRLEEIMAEFPTRLPESITYTWATDPVESDPMSTNTQRRIQRPGGDDLMALIDRTLDEADAPIGDYSRSAQILQAPDETGFVGRCWRCNVVPTANPLDLCEPCRSTMTDTNEETQATTESDRIDAGHNNPRLIELVDKLVNRPPLNEEEALEIRELLIETMPDDVRNGQSREALLDLAMQGLPALRSLFANLGEAAETCTCRACRRRRGEQNLPTRFGLTDSQVCPAEGCGEDTQIEDCPRCGGFGQCHGPNSRTVLEGVGVDPMCSCVECEAMPAFPFAGVMEGVEGATVASHWAALSLGPDLAPLDLSPLLMPEGVVTVAPLQQSETHAIILGFLAQVVPEVTIEDFCRLLTDDVLADAEVAGRSVIQHRGRYVEIVTAGNAAMGRHLTTPPPVDPMAVATSGEVTLSLYA